MEKKKLICILLFAFLLITLPNLTLAAKATFEIKSCKTSGNYFKDFDNAKICEDLHSKVKVSWIDEFGNFRIFTQFTPFTINGIKDPSKEIKVEFLERENYVFLHWVQVDEEGNGAVGGSNPYRDTQALSRTFVAFLREMPQPQKFKLKIKVVECSCNNPIANAKVQVQAVNDPTKYTDSNGLVEFELEKGNYRIIVSKNGYQTKEISVYLDKDKYLEICLEKIEEKKEGYLKIKVKDCDTDEWIKGARVEVDGKVGYTDSNGLAEFKLKEGLYEIQIEKEGYVKEKETVELNAGETKTLILCLKKIEPQKPYCELTLKDYEIYDKTVVQGKEIKIKVALRMEFENLKNPFAIVKVELVSEKDPFKIKVFEFEYSDQIKTKVFQFETHDLETGTYKVYLSARGVNDCDTIEKTYLGKITILAKPYSYYAEGFLDKYKCFDGELKRLYQHSDGSLSWVKVGVCEKQTQNYYKPILFEKSKDGTKIESIKIEAKVFESPTFNLTILWIVLIIFVLFLSFLSFKSFERRCRWRCDDERFLISV